MNIIICGAGRVGIGIAEQMLREDNEITIVDVEERLAKVDNSLDLKKVAGHPSYPEILKLAGIESADMLISVTQSDEVNMVTSYMAEKFDVQKKIARISSKGYIKEEYHEWIEDSNFIDMAICPEIEVANSVKQLLEIPGAIDTANFIDKNVIMTAFNVSQYLIGKCVSEINEQFAEIGACLFGITRKGHNIFDLDKQVLITKDQVFIFCNKENIEQLLYSFDIEKQRTRKVIIVGGGYIGLATAKYLEELNYDVKLLEKNPKIVQELASELPKSTILNGDFFEHNLMEDINLSITDLIISVTDNDQTNILSALIAKDKGCKKSVALVNDMYFSSLFSSIGIDVLLKPREITVSNILKYVRKGQTERVYSICDGMIELMEVHVKHNSSILGKKVSEIKQENKFYIPFIRRDGNMMFNNEDIRLREGDIFIIVCPCNFIKKIEKILQKK